MTNRLVYTFFLFCILVANLFAQETTDTISVYISSTGEHRSARQTIGENYTRWKWLRLMGESFLLFNNMTDGLPLNFIDSIELNNEKVALVFNDDQARHPYTVDEKGKLGINKNPWGTRWLSDSITLLKLVLPVFVTNLFPYGFPCLPPLVAIGLALIFREVIVSLFIGVWAGRLCGKWYAPGRFVDEFPGGS